MSLFRRSRSETEVASRPIFEAAPEEVSEPYTLEDFVLEYADSLAFSRQAWEVEVPSFIHTFQSEEYVAHLRKGVIGNLKKDNNDQEPEPSEADKVTDQLMRNLAVLWMVGARHTAAKDTNRSLWQTAGMTYSITLPDPQVRHAVSNVGQRLKMKWGMQFGNAVMAIESADKTAKYVLSAFADSILSDATSASEAQQIFQDAASKEDVDVVELKHMIDVDWSHPDPDKSILRTHIRNLKQEPRILLDAFCRDVAATPETGNHKLQPAYDAARLALHYAGESESAGAVESLWKAQRGFWEDISSFDAMFREYTVTQIRAIEATIGQIAGRPRVDDLRVHHADEWVENMRRNTHMARPYLSRDHRRSVGGNRQGAKQAVRAHDQIVAAINALAETEEAPIERAIFFAKGNGRLEALQTLDDAVDYFVAQNKRSPGLREDIRAILQHLQTTPRLMSGVRKIADRTLMVDGSALKLWRFAPEKCPEVRVSNAHRYMRAVFAVDGSRLIFDSFLPHDRFDQRY